MEWLLLSGLGIIWAAFFYSPRVRRASPNASVEEFERNMGLLAETERASGRWIVAPRKGERFVGHTERSRQRTRERRRRVFTVLLEAIGLTLLIGMFPPLRAMWIGTGALIVAMAAYVWFLIAAKEQELERDAQADDEPDAPALWAGDDVPRERYDERGSMGEGDMVHVQVHAARGLQTANA
jgi:hypothetical protein